MPPSQRILNHTTQHMSPAKKESLWTQTLPLALMQHVSKSSHVPWPQTLPQCTMHLCWQNNSPQIYSSPWTLCQQLHFFSSSANVEDHFQHNFRKKSPLPSTTPSPNFSVSISNAPPFLTIMLKSLYTNPLMANSYQTCKAQQSFHCHCHQTCSTLEQSPC